MVTFHPHGIFHRGKFPHEWGLRLPLPPEGGGRAFIHCSRAFASTTVTWHGVFLPLSNHNITLPIGLWYHQPMRAFEHSGLLSAYPRVHLKSLHLTFSAGEQPSCFPCEKVLEDGIQDWCKVPGMFISVGNPTHFLGRFHRGRRLLVSSPLPRGLWSGCVC